MPRDDAYELGFGVRRISRPDGTGTKLSIPGLMAYFAEVLVDLPVLAGQLGLLTRQQPRLSMAQVACTSDAAPAEKTKSENPMLKIFSRGGISITYAGEGVWGVGSGSILCHVRGIHSIGNASETHRKADSHFHNRTAVEM